MTWKKVKFHDGVGFRKTKIGRFAEILLTSSPLNGKLFVTADVIDEFPTGFNKTIFKKEVECEDKIYQEKIADALKKKINNLYFR